MTEKNVQVLVSGRPGSGKSIVVQLIMKVLQQYKISALIEDDELYEFLGTPRDEDTLRQIGRVAGINVTIKSKQVKRRIARSTK